MSKHKKIIILHAMKKTLVVPIDFTPVSHEALLYACELSVNHNVEIVAVHLLDSKILDQYQNAQNEDVKAIAQQMYQEVYQKTKNDLDNFLDGLSVFYGDIIRPLITHGTIYEAFNDVAAKYDNPLIIMGTHGITGMQHVFGSRAYKVIINTPYPFLIVQGRSYQQLANLYMIFKHANEINAHVRDINTFAGVFQGKFIFNILADDTTTPAHLPAGLQHLIERISLVHEPLLEINAVERAKQANADTIGICIDEIDNMSDLVYGIKQDKMLENNYRFPVFCLPQKR